jgi:hypothetical protein
MAEDDWAANYRAWLQGQPLPQDKGHEGFNPINPFSYYDSLSGKYGYQTAARGAQAVGDQSRAFADQQWGRQMEGLQGALGAYGPSNDYWQRNYANQGPGAMENWWQQNQGQFSGQSNQQNAYRDYNAWMGNQANNATLAGQGTAQQYLAGNTAANDAYYQMRNQLGSYSGPQNTQSAYNLANLSLRQPGAGEDYWAQNQQRYNTGGAARDVYDLYSGQLAGPSRSETFDRNMANELNSTTSDAKKNLDAMLAWSSGPTAGQKNEGENKGYVRGADDLSRFYQSQLPALQGPGTYEQFVSADINGDNPLYQRTKDRGIAQINQEMARRGGFQAPAAIDRIGNYTAELDAQDYDRRRQSAQTAQQMQLARIGQGGQLAQGVGAQKLQQGQALQGMDVANEAGELSRKGFGMQAVQNQVGNALASQKLQLEAAGQADNSALARLQGLQNMASAGDQSTLGFLNAGQNAANDAQSQQLARLMGMANMGNMADQLKLSSDQQGLARMMSSYGMAQGADQSNLARAQQIFNMGQGVDQSNLARYGMQQNAAQGTDQFNLARLLGGGQMAGNAQNAEQQRMAQAFASLFGMNNAQAGLYGQFYGQGGQLSGQAFSDAMNAYANAAGLRGQAQNAGGQYAMQLGNMALNGYGMSRYGGGGFPGGGQNFYYGPNGYQYGPNGAPIIA